MVWGEGTPAIQPSSSTLYYGFIIFYIGTTRLRPNFAPLAPCGRPNDYTAVGICKDSGSISIRKELDRWT